MCLYAVWSTKVGRIFLLVSGFQSVKLERESKSKRSRINRWEPWESTKMYTHARDISEIHQIHTCSQSWSSSPIMLTNFSNNNNNKKTLRFRKHVYPNIKTGNRLCSYEGEICRFVKFFFPFFIGPKSNWHPYLILYSIAETHTHLAFIIIRCEYVIDILFRSFFSFVRSINNKDKWFMECKQIVSSFFF